MMVSRRTFLLGSGLAVLPLTGLPLQAGHAAEPFAIGELWGMPYVARGAHAIAIPPRKARRKAPASKAPGRTFEYA